MPGAILFDLLNGGDKDWGRYPPYRELGYAAAQPPRRNLRARQRRRRLRRHHGQFQGRHRLGLGDRAATACTVGALAAVNAAGSVIVGDGPWFWAAPFEQDDEFGGHGFPTRLHPQALEPRTKGAARASTTLVVVATDAMLTKPQANRLAVMAQDGLARAIHPVHTPLDGDIVFAVATGARAARRSAVWTDAARHDGRAGGRPRDRPRRIRSDGFAVRPMPSRDTATSFRVSFNTRLSFRQSGSSLRRSAGIRPRTARQARVRLLSLKSG